MSLETGLLTIGLFIVLFGGWCCQKLFESEHSFLGFIVLILNCSICVLIGYYLIQ